MHEKTTEKFEELEKLSKPLRDWLLEHYDLMCKIIIESGRVEVLRSELATVCKIDD